jgi:hypothetical protein
MTLAAISIANLPETTTYTTDTGGDLQHPTAGTYAWIENITLPAYDETSTDQPYLRSDGNIVFGDDSLLTMWDFSESTGALLWTNSNYIENNFGLQNVAGITAAPVAAYGMLFVPNYDGYMHALNITTGIQEWATPSRTGGLQMPQPYYPLTGCIVAGGEVFFTTAKAYETEPLFQGHCLYALDATTGAQVWNISGQISVACIADGILLGTNAYDGKVYAFGPGQTATTVSAPETATQAGQPIVIRGTVTDQTPGIAMGTPAISDAWMTPWMQYLYMEQPYPTQATGVNVVITAIDPNHNFITIGNATSDITGNFHYTWTPPNIPGTYTITATFNADNSYYGSIGETATVVVPASAATTAPTAIPTSIADTYFMPAVAGLFVLIIVVAIVLALLVLRKRP